MNTKLPSSAPPRWIDRLLEWFCSEEFLEVVQGDLHEMYQRNVEEQGEKKANLLYLLDVFSLFRPFALGLNVPHFHLTTTGMYKSYLITALRNFRRQFGFSLINISGLAIGMAAFMIILVYVSFEVSYDDYHSNKNQLYRWNMWLEKPGGEIIFKSAGVSPGVAHLIRENMPEVKEVGRMFSPKETYLTISYIDDKNEKVSFNEEHTLFTESSLLSMFDFPMLFGDASALDLPNSVIISESTAERYFGTVSDDIIGRIIEISFQPDKIESKYQITGIFQDLPPNTHFQTDFLISYCTLTESDPKEFDERWNTYGYYTYMQLHPHITAEQFLEKKPQYAAMIMERNQVNNPTPEIKHKHDWLRVDDIYLKSDSPDEIKPHGSFQTIYVLFVIGLLVIVIAWVNYVNLTTAKAVQRAREVGMRKVAGAGRRQLILQFFTEAFLLNLLAFLLALIVLWGSLPFFRQLTGIPLSFHLWWQGFPNLPLFFAVLGGLFLFSTMVSGFYPALVLSSFHPLKALRGRMLLSPSRGISLRSGLVVIQFTMSVILIAGTYLMYRQIAYMQNQPLGFDKEQMLVIRSPTDITLKDESLEVFKEDLLSRTFVEDAAISSTVPGRKTDWDWAIGIDKSQSVTAVKRISIDHEFLDVYDFTFVGGRNFSKDHSTDKDAIIINESTAHMLGFDNAEAALHQNLWAIGRQDIEVIGIVRDFHQSSLKEAYYPICFMLEGATAVNDRGEIYDFKSRDRAYLSAKISSDHLQENMEWIEEKYQNYFPDTPLDYYFLDERFNQQYKSDIQFGKIFGIFASLAIFIACLGIFGLSSYLAIQRSKEIGIRKVLGSTVPNIMLLLSGKFVKLVFIASIIALPLAYFVFDQWLDNYAFRIDIEWWFFVMPVLAVFMIAIITISVQTVKAALANPVDSLKYE
ncbi:ABC transporter permease [Catalinimonas niigatensis]|uniref:ABC transporter permease n=1 Tax=Catalinimonas niigatensis TaxID=1397264 RepID=UPI002665B53D|nr:ABC transporter permease [Catalinimonas niigatensis]WPP51969.1 permease prefix domain 2-containing transporter [Catalinimonas niigatensis]